MRQSPRHCVTSRSRGIHPGSMSVNVPGRPLSSSSTTCCRSGSIAFLVPTASSQVTAVESAPASRRSTGSEVVGSLSVSSCPRQSARRGSGNTPTLRSVFPGVGTPLGPASRPIIVSGDELRRAVVRGFVRAPVRRDVLLEYSGAHFKQRGRQLEKRDTRRSAASDPLRRPV